MKFRGGMGELMRQASRMQRKIEKRREELKEMEFEAGAGNDLVKVTVNGGAELIKVEVDPKAPTPPSEQIADQVRFAVAGGRIAVGDKLPSVRGLAAQALVNPNTVARVYTELEREGILNTRPGRGVFVAQPTAELTKKARKQRFQDRLDGFLTEAVHLGFSADEVVRLVSQRVKQFQWQSKG